MTRLGKCEGLEWLVVLVSRHGGIGHDFEFCENEQEAKRLAERWLADLETDPLGKSDCAGVYVSRVRWEGPSDTAPSAKLDEGNVTPCGAP